MPIAFPGVNINEQQKVRDSLSNFAKALSGLAEQKQLQKRNALLSQIFQPEPTTTSDDIAFNSPESVATGNFALPTSNPSAIDPSQSVQAGRPLTRVEQIKQREGARKKAYETVYAAQTKAGLPAEKAEAYFKYIDKMLPEIEAREVDATNKLTGAEEKALETDPRFSTGELILGTEPTKQTLTYFDKAGTKRQIRVPEAQFNQVENAIVSSGGRLDKEDKVDKTPLQKHILERQKYIDQGMKEDDPIIKAYDAKISGTDIDIEGMTQEEIDTWGQIVNLTGKMPSLGRGKQSTKMRVAIAKSAARQALNAASLIPGSDPNKKPSQAALEVIGTQSDTKAVSGAITFLQKQTSAMGSFVNNIGRQVDKVAELSKDLETYDTRFLNIPLRAVRGKIVGSPLQAKYDLYLTEIEAEIGKLATGSSASIAELSTSAQERWDRIHDKNLSVKDMLELLEETKSAARMRLRSVEDELDKTRKKMRTRDFAPSSIAAERPPLSAFDRR